MEHIEVDEYERERAQAEHDEERRRGRREEPADPRVDPVEEPIGIDALEAKREDVRDRTHAFLEHAFGAAFVELLALAGGVGDHEAAAMEHADELLQFFG